MVDGRLRNQVLEAKFSMQEPRGYANPTFSVHRTCPGCATMASTPTASATWLQAKALSIWLPQQLMDIFRYVEDDASS